MAWMDLCGFIYKFRLIYVMCDIPYSCYTKSLESLKPEALNAVMFLTAIFRDVHDYIFTIHPLVDRPHLDWTSTLKFIK